MHAKDTTATNYFLNCKTMSRTWINMNKKENTRDMIAALKKPAPLDGKLERCLTGMTEIARLHHKQLQDKDKPTDRQKHNHAIKMP